MVEKGDNKNRPCYSEENGREKVVTRPGGNWLRRGNAYLAYRYTNNSLLRDQYLAAAVPLLLVAIERFFYSRIH